MDAAKKEEVPPEERKDASTAKEAEGDKKSKRPPRVRKDGEAETAENEIMVAAKGQIKNYLGYAFRILNKTAHKNLKIRATGNAIVKALILIELVKRKVSEIFHYDLYQLNKIYSMEIKSMEEAKIGQIETIRRVTAMDTILSKDPLDEKDPGYQFCKPEPKVEGSKPAQQKPKAGPSKKKGGRQAKTYNDFGDDNKDGEKGGKQQRRGQDTKDKHEHEKDKEDKQVRREKKEKKKSRRENLRKIINDDEGVTRGGRRGGAGGPPPAGVRRRGGGGFRGGPPGPRDMDRDYMPMGGPEYLGPRRGYYDGPPPMRSNDDFNIRPQRGHRGGRRGGPPDHYPQGPHGGGYYPPYRGYNQFHDEYYYGGPEYGGRPGMYGGPPPYPYERDDFRGEGPPRGGFRGGRGGDRGRGNGEMMRGNRGGMRHGDDDDRGPRPTRGGPGGPMPPRERRPMDHDDDGRPVRGFRGGRGMGPPSDMQFRGGPFMRARGGGGPDRGGRGFRGRGRSDYNNFGDRGGHEGGHRVRDHDEPSGGVIIKKRSRGGDPDKRNEDD